MSHQENEPLLHFLIVESVTLLILSASISVLLVYFARQIRQKQAELFSAVLESQEKERKRIGKDLHDEMGPLLSAARMHLEFLKSPGAKNNPVLCDFQKLLDEAIQGIRTSVQALVPNTLYYFGLVAAIRELCHKLSCPSCRIEFFPDKMVHFEVPVQLNIYRIVQELLNNAVKHSGASRIKVSLVVWKETLTIRIEDNGIGFDVRKVERSGGIGLKNIESRVSALGGKILLKSGIGKGTSVQIDVTKGKNLNAYEKAKYNYS
jgi:two-component system, NarL family, sensor kinase